MIKINQNQGVNQTPLAQNARMEPAPSWVTIRSGNGTGQDGGPGQTQPINASRVEDAIKGLRQIYPNGHKDFIAITLDEISLHSRKNKDYAEGGDPLGNFRRTETIKRLYPGLDWASDYGGAVDYMLKQLDAVLWSMAHNKGTECESLDDKLRDISVYAKLIRIMLTDREPFKAVVQAASDGSEGCGKRVFVPTGSGLLGLRPKC